MMVRPAAPPRMVTPVVANPMLDRYSLYTRTAVPDAATISMLPLEPIVS